MPVTMKRVAARTILTALGAIAATLAIGAVEARADFRVCNDGSETVGVAIGYRGTDGWVSEGWWHVEPQGCEVLVAGTLSSCFFYLYAENAERSRRWGGEVRMCTAEETFKIPGVKDCVARGFSRTGFGEYDTGNQASWTVRLAPAEDGGSGEATAAAAKVVQ